jgi:hypothetical protein
MGLLGYWVTWVIGLLALLSYWVYLDGVIVLALTLALTLALALVLTSTSTLSFILGFIGFID